MKGKILFINFNIHNYYQNNDFPVGGATVQTSNWIKGFQINQYSVGVLGYKGTNHSHLVEKGIDYLETYNINKGIKIIRNLYYRFPKILSAVRKYNPDLIYMDVPGWNSIIYLIISKILKKIFILRISNDFMVDGRCKNSMGYFKYLLFMLSVRFADIKLCQNEYQYELLKNQYIGSKIYKLYNPFDFNDILTPAESRKFIAWVGIFQYQKNLRTLYKIAHALPNMKFRVAGKTYDYVDDDTRDSLNKLKTLNNVKFVGYVKNKNIRIFLADAYCLINTSFYEGFSNTYLEALSAGTPIITTTATDPDMIIQKNVLGIVANNYNEMIKIIPDILNFNYERFYKRAKDYLIENHNPSTLVNNLIDFINTNY